jgi:hypothetical protein
LIEGGIPLSTIFVNGYMYYMSAIQNEQIHSDLHKIGGWGSVLSSKHPCTPLKNLYSEEKNV